MALESRLRELDAKHRDLDLRIHSELQRPAVDWAEVHAMKRMKLRMKEEMERLKRIQPPRH